MVAVVLFAVVARRKGRWWSILLSQRGLPGPVSRSCRQGRESRSALTEVVARSPDRGVPQTLRAELGGGSVAT